MRMSVRLAIATTMLVTGVGLGEVGAANAVSDLSRPLPTDPCQPDGPNCYVPGPAPAPAPPAAVQAPPPAYVQVPEDTSGRGSDGGGGGGGG